MILRVLSRILLALFTLAPLASCGGSGGDQSAPIRQVVLSPAGQADASVAPSDAIPAMVAQDLTGGDGKDPGTNTGGGDKGVITDPATNMDGGKTSVITDPDSNMGGGKTSVIADPDSNMGGGKTSVIADPGTDTGGIIEPPNPRQSAAWPHRHGGSRRLLRISSTVGDQQPDGSLVPEPMTLSLGLIGGLALTFRLLRRRSFTRPLGECDIGPGD